jgi:hypothetical protein
MTDDRTTPGPLVLCLVAGAGLVAIAVGVVVILSVRGPAPTVARTEPTPLPRPEPVKPPILKPREVTPVPHVKKTEPPPDPPRVGKLNPEPAPVPSRYKVGSAVEQEVTFSRRSVYRVQGIEVAQAAKYTVTSDLVVTAVHPDGGCAMKQTIRSTRLGECDPALKQEMQAALEKTHGTEFELTVGPDGQVRKFTGLKEAVNVQVPNDPGRTATFRVWSLLDSGAWAELAGMTLLKPPAGEESWTRPIAHDWGPLGGWVGRTTFRNNSRQHGQDRIDFTHALTHRPPVAGAGEDLPLKIVSVEFRSPNATGSILFDATTDRVTRAEETFQVRGRVTVAAVGSEAVIELEERQDFQLTNREATDRNLKGGPKK